MSTGSKCSGKLNKIPYQNQVFIRDGSSYIRLIILSLALCSRTVFTSNCLDWSTVNIRFASLLKITLHSQGSNAPGGFAEWSCGSCTACFEAKCHPFCTIFFKPNFFILDFRQIWHSFAPIVYCATTKNMSLKRHHTTPCDTWMCYTLVLHRPARKGVC